jgi:hypothetical protein
MGVHWLHSVPSDPTGGSVTIRELIERYGEFHEEDGRRLLTHRGVVRVARQVRRARRDGTLAPPGDRGTQPPPSVP